MTFSSPQFWERFKASHLAVEAAVSDRPGAYCGLSPEALYTSAEDLDLLLRHHLVTGTFADLGCGAGAAVLTYAMLHPDRRSVGVEFDAARAQKARALAHEFGLTNVNIVEDDLLTAQIPEADVYFLYFPTGPVLDRVLEELYRSQRIFRLLAIESHGDLLPRLEFESYLELREEIPLVSARHYPKARLYERIFKEQKPGPFNLSFRERYLVIDDGHECWVGEGLGLTWTMGARFELVTPPRTIYWEQVTQVCELADFSLEVQHSLTLRRSGPVIIKTNDRLYRGELRKILLTPVFRLELSTGERVEWDNIITMDLDR